MLLKRKADDIGALKDKVVTTTTHMMHILVANTTTGHDIVVYLNSFSSYPFKHKVAGGRGGGYLSPLHKSHSSLVRGLQQLLFTQCVQSMRYPVVLTLFHD